MQTQAGNLDMSGPNRVRIAPWLTRGWEGFLQDAGNFVLIGLIAAVFLHVAVFLVVGPVFAGLAAVSIKAYRQQSRIEVRDFFNGFAFYFLPALLSSLLTFLFVLLGLILLIVPGLVIAAMYMFTFHFIVDREQDFWQAMESSRRIVSRDYVGFTLFGVVLGLLNLLGLAFFWVGIVVTMPLTALAVTAAYQEFVGTSNPAGPESLPPPVRIE